MSIAVQTDQLKLMRDSLESQGQAVTFSTYYMGKMHHHPDYAPGATGVAANDIAVIVLTDPLPAWHHLFTIYPHSEPPFGSVVNTAGYGVFGTGEEGYCSHVGTSISNCSPVFNLGGVLRSGYNTLESYGLFPNTVSTDFDAPPDAAWQGNPYGGRDPVSQLTSKGTTYLETMTASGDSGGPLVFNPAQSLSFRRNSLPPGTTVKAVPDQYFLLGVLSYASDTSFEWGTGRCAEPWNLLSVGTCTTPTQYNEKLLGTYGDNDTFTLVYPYLDWIRSFSAVSTTAFKVQDELVTEPVPRVTADLFAGNVTDAGVVEPVIITPAPNSIHAVPTSLGFTWRSMNPDITEWRLYVGSTSGKADLFDSGPITGESGAVTSTEMLGVPIDGRRLHARLWYRDYTNRWGWVDSVYRTYDEPIYFVPELIDPAPGSTLQSGTVTFRWDDHGYGAQAHWLEVENASDGATLYSSGNRLGGISELVVENLPEDGRSLIATLYYGRGNGVYFGNKRQYRLTAFDADGVPPGIPDLDSPGTTLASTSEFIGWADNDWGADEYRLYVGSSPGANNYHDSGELGTARSDFVRGLPVNGETVHARLFFRRTGGAWQHSDSTYTATSDGGDAPSIISPRPLSLLQDTTIEFEWSDNGTPITAWRVTAGTAPAEQDLFDSGELAEVKAVRIPGLPDDGSPVYLRLGFRDTLGVWRSVDEIYTAVTASLDPGRVIPNNAWRLISLPSIPPAGANTVADLFGDDITGDYDETWKLWGYDTVAGNYVDPLSTGTLTPGKAYWIIQITGGDVMLDMPAGSTPTPVTLGMPCSATEGCMPITLAATGADPAWDLVGNPFYTTPSSGSLRVSTIGGTCGDADGCTVTEANENGANVLHNVFFGWNGGPTYESISSGSSWEVWTGYWSAVLPAGNGLSPILHVPAN